MNRRQIFQSYIIFLNSDWSEIMKTTIDPSIIDEIFNKTKAELEKLIPVNIMIIGIKKQVLTNDIDRI